MSPRRRAPWLALIAASSLIAAWAGTAFGQSAPSMESESGLPRASAVQLQRVFRAALAAVRPAIVRIDTVGGAPSASGGAFPQVDGPSTGVVWSADGYVVTSSFNFARDPLIITVTRDDGTRQVAQLVARDIPARLALLRVEAGALSPPRWVERDALRPGQWTLAAGYGHVTRGPAVTVGTLSAIERFGGLALQTDAKTSPANYGGPLFNLEGRVLGICVPIAAGEDELAGVDWYDSGIGFAIPTDVLRERIERLKRGHDLRRGLLGVVLDPRAAVVGGDWTGEAGRDPAESAPGSAPQSQPAPASQPAIEDLLRSEPPEDGVRILSVAPDGPAAAHLRPGDVILRVDDQPVRDLLAFRRCLTRFSAGDIVRVTVRREAERVSAEITLIAGEAAASQPQLP